MFEVFEFTYGKFSSFGTFASVEEAKAIIPGTIADIEEDEELPGFYNVLAVVNRSALLFIIKPV